jgi:hypothetical protein
MSWINVKDRKPPNTDEVAVLHTSVANDKKPFKLMARFYKAETEEDEDEWHEVNSTCGCCQYFDEKRITHWAKLPEIENYGN